VRSREPDLVTLAAQVSTVAGVAKKRAANDADRAEFRRRILATVGAGEDLDALSDYLWSLDGFFFPFPADAICELGADALALAGATRTTPLSLEGAYERFLPDYEFRGNTARQKRRVALELVITVHAGIEPDYYEAAGWWRVQDLYRYSLCAAVVAIGLAAERTGSTVADVCRHQMDGTVTSTRRRVALKP
jgi:hypothetical protein